MYFVVLPNQCLVEISINVPSIPWDTIQNALLESQEKRLSIILSVSNSPSSTRVKFISFPEEILEKLLQNGIHRCVFGVDMGKSDMKELKVLDGNPGLSVVSPELSLSHWIP